MVFTLNIVTKINGSFPTFITNLPEWEEAKPGRSSVDVSFERIMELENKSPEEIQGVKKESAVDCDMDAILARIAK